jgi:acyl-CoA synthetase (AMP-forming)/AMP-acid ligase II
MRELETPSAELAEDEDIATIVALHAREGAWRPAVIDGDRRVDWREHGDRIHQFANALIGLGIQKGDRVATLGRNRIEYQEAFLGTLLAGGCAVPLPTMASPEALWLMLEDSEAKVLVVTADHRETVAAFVQELAAIVDGGLAGFDFEDDLFRSYEEWMDAAPGHAPGVAIDPEDDFDIIYRPPGCPRGSSIVTGSGPGWPRSSKLSRSRPTSSTWCPRLYTRTPPSPPGSPPSGGAEPT